MAEYTHLGFELGAHFDLQILDIVVRVFVLVSSLSGYVVVS